jgi:TPR repeat protein
MFPHFKFSKELSLLRKLIKADNQDVLHDRRQQLYYYFAMKLFVSLRFLKGCPNARRMIHLHTLILRRLITNMPAALYQHALALVSTGQCAAAMVHLNRANPRGHLPSHALKAHMLLQGREGVAKDCNAAFELVEEGSRLGCHHCQGVMANCYLFGDGIRADAARSLELARESSGKGSRYGQHFLGLVCRNSEGRIALYRLAAAQNFDEAQYDLGGMYHSGISIEQNNTLALRWYQLAAAQGHPGALYMVAFYHEFGKGVRRDWDEAICWYKRAKKAGHPCAADALKRLGALE